MKNTSSIARWSLLGLLVTACTPDAIVSPVEQAEETVLAKKGGIKPGQDEACEMWNGHCVEFGTDQRFRHWRFYPDAGTIGVVRECGINALERNTVPRIHTNNSQRLHLNEQDAVLMIRELDTNVPSADNPDEGAPTPRWRVTHIGRARWEAKLWWTADGEVSTSWNSTVHGLVAPWPEADGRETEGPINLVYDGPGGPPNQAGADLDKPDSSPGGVFDQAVSDFLNAADEDDLVGVTCKLNVQLPGSAGQWTTQNSVDLDFTPAKGLKQLLNY